MQKCFIVIRADNYSAVLTTLSDMVRHINIDVHDPRILPVSFCHDIRSNVFSYKKERGVNVIASSTEPPPRIIARLGLLHSPAHITVVSDIHTIYSQLYSQMSEFRKLHGFTKPKKCSGK